MKPMSGKQFAKLLERHGWTLLRVHDSHHIDGKPVRVLRLCITPISSFRRKPESSLLKQLGTGFRRCDGLFRASLAKLAGISDHDAV